MLGGARVVVRAQLSATQHRAHLNIKISVGLGGGPDGEEQVHGIDWCHATGPNPAVDHSRLVLHHVAQLGSEQALDNGGAVQEFVGKHFGGMGALG